MSAFSPREVAADLYNAALALGTSRVLGADHELLQSERKALLDKAINACRRAVDTPRVLLREPDDEMLDSWLQQLQRRRGELTN